MDPLDPDSWLDTTYQADPLITATTPSKGRMANTMKVGEVKTKLQNSSNFISARKKSFALEFERNASNNMKLITNRQVSN